MASRAGKDHGENSNDIDNYGQYGDHAEPVCHGDDYREDGADDGCASIYSPGPWDETWVLPRYYLDPRGEEHAEKKAEGKKEEEAYRNPHLFGSAQIMVEYRGQQDNVASATTASRARAMAMRRLGLNGSLPLR